MSSDVVTDSAHPINEKVATLSQEVSSRQANCDRRTHIEDRLQILEKFTTKLYRSGYCQLVAAKIMSNGIVSYDQAVKTEEGGGKYVHQAAHKTRIARFRTKL